jgi:hypothetical protein
MVFLNYKIEGDSITLNKKELVEIRDHYCKVADMFKPKHKKQDLVSLWAFYIGKSVVCIDLLKHFEPLKL